MAKRSDTQDNAEDVKEVGFRENDDQYLGVDPIYAQAAYEATAPFPADEPEEVSDDDDEVTRLTKERLAAEAEMEARVREHTEAMKQPEVEKVPFDEWLAKNGSVRVARYNATTGEEEVEDEDVTKADLMERARELDVAGRSNMSKEELQEAVAEAEVSQTS